MKVTGFIVFLIPILICNACKKEVETEEILQKTIYSIDTIETISYKQDMWRSDPQNINDSIFRYRKMYFKRLITDSIVGVKGHWYMYVNDKENLIYEDIYDGNKLVRKNNRDSVARIYDLLKYPDFKRTHFWSHNTLYGMQYEFRYMLAHTDSYTFERLGDQMIDNQDCYQIMVMLEHKMTMPGFASKLEDNEGIISKTVYFIDKERYYPIRIRGENYAMDDPGQKTFIDQRYYDIEFNQTMDENILFNTSDEVIKGFEKIEIKSE